MSIAIGTRLGPYEIVAPLGAGGMGEVYRARDTRLGRDVAVKILPAEVSGDPSRRQRFEQEARAVAALNHPNIIAIYDVGEGYIVSELVDGESLRGLKPGLRKTIDIGVQIAAGLAAAHAAGITHRDLKPENVLLARDGPGMVMGTVGYMSPEQVRGQTADQRSDIFSFGLILYELLAGKRAFSGDTSVETMTAILKEDAADLPETVPSGVRQIVAHCLEKDPDNRFQSAKDLGFALLQFERPSVTSAARPVKIRRWRKFLLPVGVAAIVAIAFFAGHALWRPPAPTQWSGTLLGATEIAQWPRLSPDGHLLAFVGPDSEDFMQVWVMKPESGNRIMLTHRRDLGYAQMGSWSPDGSRIFFGREEGQEKGVFSVPALGGEEQMVLETGSVPEALPDGSLLVNQLNKQQQLQLYRYWPDTGKTRSFDIILPEPDLGTIRAFPDGRHAVVSGVPMKPGSDNTLRLYVVDLESGAIRALDADLGGARIIPAAVTRDGKSIVFTGLHGSMIRLWSVPADGGSPPHPLFNLTAGGYGMDIGTDGSIYVDSQERPENIVRFTPDGRHLEHIARIIAPPDDSLAVLPDGRAVWLEFIGGRTRLMMGGAAKDPALFVNTTEETAGPLTAAGADAVAFLIGPQRKPDIAVAAVATGRIVSRIPFDKGRMSQMASSPDGKVLYCAAQGTIWAVPAVGGGEPRRIAAGDSVTADPDGKSVLVLSRDNATTRLVRVPLDGGAAHEIPINGSVKPGYRIDNGSLQNGRLVAPGSAPTWYWAPIIFDLTTGKTTRIPLDFVSDFHSMSWTADSHIIAATMDWQSTFWKFTPER